MPLLFRVLRSNRCNSKNLRMVLKSLPCGLVAGKSLMLMAIVVEKLFRLSNGQSAILYLINPNIRTVMPLGCVSCVPPSQEGQCFPLLQTAVGHRLEHRP
jgi:hypothetical protein